LFRSGSTPVLPGFWICSIKPVEGVDKWGDPIEGTFDADIEFELTSDEYDEHYDPRKTTEEYFDDIEGDAHYVSGRNGFDDDFSDAIKAAEKAGLVKITDEQTNFLVECVVADNYRAEIPDLDDYKGMSAEDREAEALERRWEESRCRDDN